jgi:hypothetical protein
MTADTAVLVRVAVMDDPVQSALAVDALLEAEPVAVTLPSLCEFVWVLTRGYNKSAIEIAEAIRKLMNSASVLADRPAVEAGLAILERGAILPMARSPLRDAGQEAASLPASTASCRTGRSDWWRCEIALKAMSECSNQVSTRITSLPSCGRPRIQGLTVGG